VFLAAAPWLAVGCGDGGRSDRPATVETVVWRRIGSWSGRGPQQTDAFLSDTGAFRVHWQTSNESPPETGRFRVVLHSGVSGRPLLVVAEHRGIGRNTAYVNEDPREFFVVIESANLDWSVTVEEGVRASTPAATIRR
jgi:hypothetical protein